MPQANEGGKKGDIRYKFLLTLNNGMNWQNLHIVVDQQALWATLEGILDAIESRLNGTTSEDDDKEYLNLFGQEPEWFTQQADGILTHALQLRVALETRSRGEPVVVEHVLGGDLHQIQTVGLRAGGRGEHRGGPHVGQAVQVRVKGRVIDGVVKTVGSLIGVGHSVGVRIDLRYGGVYREICGSRLRPEGMTDMSCRKTERPDQ